MSVKVTKFEHACILVETSEGAALFDPGTMSEGIIEVAKLPELERVFISHIHADHCSEALIHELQAKQPDLQLTVPKDVMAMLADKGIASGTDFPPYAEFFDAPHEDISVMFGAKPDEIGIHYRGVYSHPGDSHSFHETMPILGLPVQAPWGSTVNAVKLALELKPQHVIPIHDWHWSDAARESTYNSLEKIFAEHGITFHKMTNGIPVEIDL